VIDTKFNKFAKKNHTRVSGHDILVYEEPVVQSEQLEECEEGNPQGAKPSRVSVGVHTSTNHSKHI